MTATHVEITAADGYAYLSAMRAAKRAQDEGDRELAQQLLHEAERITERFRVGDVTSAPYVSTRRGRLADYLRGLADRIDSPPADG